MNRVIKENSTNKPPSYKSISALMTVVVVGSNALGAFFSFSYFSFIDPLPQGAQAVSVPQAYGMVISIGGTIALLLGGVFLSTRFERYYPAWFKRVEAGESAQKVPEEARLEVINYPFTSALIAFVMWLLAGVFFGALTGRGAAAGFLRIFGVGGILATAINFFAIEWLWRPVIAFLVPDGRLDRLKGYRLPVFRRLVAVFFLIGFYPAMLITAISLSRARVLLTAENPQAIYGNLLIAVLFILTVSGIIGMGMAFLVTRSIVQPLEELTRAMNRVEQNDLDVSVPVVSKDELGYVSEKFNDMVRGLKRGELLRNLLNLYVSPEVAREALEHGTQLGGQTVECTVLFSDIRGFTTISEQLPADVLMDLLNRYMSLMVDVIVANGGVVNKFGGDSLLAVFGTPLNPSAEHAWGAVKTALDMQRALVQFNAEQTRVQLPQLRIGVGVATGKVVAGNIGGQGRIEYTVIGDTVNLASRLQSMTKEVGQDILINEAAYLALTEKPIHAKPLPPLEIRGKAESVKVFSIGDEPDTTRT